MVKKIKRIDLTRSFMEEHGERKKAMKVSWDEYIHKLERQQTK